MYFWYYRLADKHIHYLLLWASQDQPWRVSTHCKPCKYHLLKVREY